MAASALFKPVRVGLLDLQHRIVMAPLTRYRVADDHVPLDWVIEHYEQRSSVPGTLLISEATLIAPKAGTYANAPGVWSDAQVAQWKKVVDAVHAKNSFIYLQLWALGRTADAEQLKKEVPDADFVSSGDIAVDGGPKPRPLTVAEIDEYVTWYATAAHNAVHRAGFDGVEIHGANGYLIEQFIQEGNNNRTDEYGGSIENRNRFALRVVDAVVKTVGAERTGIRLSPFYSTQGEDIVPTYSHLITELKKFDLAFLHVIRSRTPPANGNEAIYHDEVGLQFARDIWAPRPFLIAGGFTPESAIEAADLGAAKGENLLVVFGRHFLANPDLPLRIKNGIQLNPYDRATFFARKSAKGYNDYPFADAVGRATN